jgi:large subunit ribosomal protein L4
VLERADAIAALSFRNLPAVQLINVGELNAYDVLCNDWVVFTQGSLSALTGSAAGADLAPGAQAAVASARPVDDDKIAESAVDQDDAADEAPPATPRGIAAATVATAAELGADTEVERAAGFDIKGNADSMLYHVPGGRWYDATEAEEWFDTEEAAQAAGYSKAGAGAKRAGFDIKGNADSMLYHVPGGRWYDATEAEEWFDTEEAAQAAGYSKAGEQREESR